MQRKGCAQAGPRERLGGLQRQGTISKALQLPTLVPQRPSPEEQSAEQQQLPWTPVLPLVLGTFSRDLRSKLHCHQIQKEAEAGQVRRFPRMWRLPGLLDTLGEPSPGLPSQGDLNPVLYMSIDAASASVPRVNFSLDLSLPGWVSQRHFSRLPSNSSPLWPGSL